MTRFLLTVTAAALLVAVVLAGSYLFGTPVEPTTDWSTLHACAELSRDVSPAYAADVLAVCAQ